MMSLACGIYATEHRAIVSHPMKKILIIIMPQRIINRTEEIVARHVHMHLNENETRTVLKAQSTCPSSPSLYASTSLFPRAWGVVSLSLSGLNLHRYPV